MKRVTVVLVMLLLLTAGAHAQSIYSGAIACESVEAGNTRVVIESYTAAPQRFDIRTSEELSSESVELPVLQWHQSHWKMLSEYGRALAHSIGHIQGIARATVSGNILYVEIGKQFEWMPIRGQLLRAIDGAMKKRVVIALDMPVEPLRISMECDSDNSWVEFHSSRPMSQTRMFSFGSEQSLDAEVLGLVGPAGTAILKSLFDLGVSSVFLSRYEVSVSIRGGGWTHRQEMAAMSAILDALDEESFPCLPANQ